MNINTTYPNSISFTPDQEDAIHQAGTIDVFNKSDGKFITQLKSSDVLYEAQHVYVKDKFGNTKRSYYKVYKF